MQLKTQKTVDFIQQKSAEGYGPAFNWIANNPQNNFAKSLNDQLTRNSFLSDKQLSAAMRNTATIKIDTRKDNFQKLFEAFEMARKTGKERLEKKEAEVGRSLTMKNPIFRAGVVGDTHGIRLTMAGPNARPENRGCLYVTEDAPYEDRAYLGKIMPDGGFKPSRDATDLQRQAVDLVADDPWKAAIEYGRAMGRCSMCGRTLTADKSIEDGIGPVCKKNWGL